MNQKNVSIIDTSSRSSFRNTPVPLNSNKMSSSLAPYNDSISTSFDQKHHSAFRDNQISSKSSSTSDNKKYSHLSDKYNQPQKFRDSPTPDMVRPTSSFEPAHTPTHAPYPTIDEEIDGYQPISSGDAKRDKSTANIKGKCLYYTNIK